MAFSFGFSGDDIDTEVDETSVQNKQQPQDPSGAAPAASAFPVPGKPQLPATHHPLPSLLSQLPSKIAFSCLDVTFENGDSMRIPRRELWDVRVQLMAEDDGQGGLEGLGEHDVKTGVYEGGFKSWESSVDLVKVLEASKDLYGPAPTPVRVVELGCGTALPSLAMFQWASRADSEPRRPFSFVIADYNPTVLQLVTLPNFILAWALSQPANTPALHEALTGDEETGDEETGDEELELTPEVIGAFQNFLAEANIDLSFLSGAWSSEFVDLVYSYSADPVNLASPTTLVLGAETIYSPFALQAFTETVFSILERERKASGTRAAAFVAAKRLYFGVGGSLDDFTANAQERGAIISQLREETEGVRRGVVHCALHGGDTVR